MDVRTEIGGLWPFYCLVPRRMLCFKLVQNSSSYARRAVRQEAVDCLRVLSDVYEAFCSVIFLFQTFLLLSCTSCVSGLQCLGLF